jgi:hypothetical protein
MRQSPVRNFAQTGKIIRHAYETPMNHDAGVFRQPPNLARDRGPDSRIEFA